MQFGKNVKNRREALKKTKTELAGLCEIDYRTILRIERGEYGVTLHIIYALADALETTASDLVKVQPKAKL